MSKLRVRVYNVRFGDAILVSVPDSAETGEPMMRHILIDVGNVLSGEGGVDDVFEPVLKDVQRELAGRPLDLYVMTHEHMDHVQGLPYGSAKLGLKLEVDYAWLTASAAPDYYARFEDAHRKRLLVEQVFHSIELLLNASGEPMPAAITALMANNNPRSTGACVSYLRELARRKTSFVFRGCDFEGTHPFRDAGLTILAPEEDTSVYYGRFRPMALGIAVGARGSRRPVMEVASPPAGVDAGAFYDLVEARRSGLVENLLAIDQAANNSSVVFVLEWRSWQLLFAGDAELRSWQEMNRQGVLDTGPVHFLKVSHHGSHNGTPASDLLDKILPVPPLDSRRRTAVISTCPGTYNNVPDDDTIEELGRRCEIKTVLGLPDGAYLDVEFDG